MALFAEANFLSDSTTFGFAGFLGGSYSSFESATFRGTKIDFDHSRFERTTFESATFSAETTSFGNTFFAGRTWFRGAVFNSETTLFTGAEFSGTTWFDGAKFLGKETLFVHAYFSGAQTFPGTDFGFGKVTFEQPGSWEGNKFDWDDPATGTSKPPNVEPSEWPPSLDHNHVRFLDGRKWGR
jgi:hypothetical protein